MSAQMQTSTTETSRFGRARHVRCHVCPNADFYNIVKIVDNFDLNQLSCLPKCRLLQPKRTILMIEYKSCHVCPNADFYNT